MLEEEADEDFAPHPDENISESDASQPSDSSDKESSEEELIAVRDREDNLLVEEMIQKRRDQVDLESAEVLGDQTFSPAALEKMKDVFVWVDKETKKL